MEFVYDRDGNVDSWEAVMFLYKSALKKMTLNMQILNDEFEYVHQYNPIEHIKSRLKEPESIVKKLKRHGYDSTLENMVKYVKDIDKKPKDNSVALRTKMQQCRDKIEKLTVALASNSESAAAKYIVNEIEKLDCEYNNLMRKSASQSAEERRTAVKYKNALEKREEIIRLLDDFDKFSANERNAIAKDVLKECKWDGKTLFIML